jgi:hypothetical protein
LLQGKAKCRCHWPEFQNGWSECEGLFSVLFIVSCVLNSEKILFRNFRMMRMDKNWKKFWPKNFHLCLHTLLIGQNFPSSTWIFSRLIEVYFNTSPSALPGAKPKINCYVTVHFSHSLQAEASNPSKDGQWFTISPPLVSWDRLRALHWCILWYL